LQVHQLKGERSYHIFYQLVRGTKDKTQREALRLPGKPSDFAYLAKSGCTVSSAAAAAAA
jgi:myosin-5